MSIINDILNSLEEDKKSPIEGETIDFDTNPLGSSGGEPPRNRFTKKIKYYCALFVAFAFGLTAWFVLGGSKDKEVSSHFSQSAVSSKDNRSQRRVVRYEKRIMSHKEEENNALMSRDKVRSFRRSSFSSVKSRSEIMKDKLPSDLIDAFSIGNERKFLTLVNDFMLDPSWKSSLPGITDKLREKGRNDVVIALIESLVKEKPKDASLKIKLAHLYIEQEEFSKTVALLRSGHVAMKDNLPYFGLLAYSLMKDKKYQASIDLYQQLVSIEATNPTWWMGLGFAYLYSSDRQHALMAFERAQAHADKQAPYRYYLSQKIHQLIGDDV